MSQKGEFSYRPQNVNCEANISEFIFNTLMARNSFIQLVMVSKVKEGPLLDVIPLVSGFSADGSRIDNTPVFNVPVWRLQRGASAVIMDPVEGDIGLMLCCDRDITKVRKEKKESLPASMRVHSKSDGIYLGGVLNSAPTQYVKFSDDGIDIVSPLVVSVSGKTVIVNGEETISLNSPVIEVNGQLTQGSGSYAGDAVFGGTITATGEITGSGIKLSTHSHGGVERGSSNTDSPNP